MLMVTPFFFRFSLKTNEDLSGGVLVLGSVNLNKVEFSAGQSKSFRLRLGVTAPGVYRCKCLGLSMDRGEAEEQKKAFAPLQVSFAVTQK